ncbi:MAG: hypothetical protein ABI551_08560 [Polyangiaceae bacterium]
MIAIPESERAAGQLHLRYEDVAQDGRLLLSTLPVALGTLWRAITIPPELRAAMREKGILPILTRFELEAGPGPFPVEAPIEVEGGYRLAHAVGDDGHVTRLFLDMDARLSGKKGRTNLPPPDDHGVVAVAGTLAVEHVFTRPFAPPGERKVLALELAGGSVVPSAKREWQSPESASGPPAGAKAVDDSFVADPVIVALGVMHTDSNQHVNSLVYPRLFEEASLRRFAALGRSTAVLARSLVVAYRRPSFAGESLRFFVRTFEDDGKLVTTGLVFGAADDTSDPRRARVFLRLTFE